MNKNYISLSLFPVSLILLSACNNEQNSTEKEASPTDTTYNRRIATNNLIDFGKRYASAWCSQMPGNVAAFFSENGSLTVNNGIPAIGRDSISKVAESFMTAFPDMIVSMDSLPVTSNGIEFHWTLTGTNSGPNGTGKKIRISGVEHWQLDDTGFIKQSRGSFDTDEYNRQLKYGVNN